MRWRLKLKEYDYTVIYKAGTANKNADALSRNPAMNNTYLSVLPVHKRPRLLFQTTLSDSEDETEEWVSLGHSSNGHRANKHQIFYTAQLDTVQMDTKFSTQNIKYC